MQLRHCSNRTNRAQDLAVAKVTTAFGTLGAVQHNKALSPEQNDHIRGVLEKIIEEHDGVVSRAAKVLGVSHSLLFEIRDGRRGAGTKVLTALAQYTGRSIDDLMGRPPVVREPSEHHEGDELQHHPLWSSVLLEFQASAARRGEQLIEDVVREMATASLSRAYRVLTVAGLRRLYEALMQMREDDPAA